MKIFSTNRVVLTSVLIVLFAGFTQRSFKQEVTEPYSCPYCDLSGESFVNRDLTNANLIGANLQRADFSGAKLSGAQLLFANLEDADLEGATIDQSNKARADFSVANLTRANFKNAEIGAVKFQYADITCADFSNTDLSEAIFGSQLKFSLNSPCRPKFNDAVLTCEFPWHWPDLQLENAKLPDCDNLKQTLLPGDQENTPATPISGKPEARTIADLAAPYISKSKLPAFQDTVWVNGDNGRDSQDCGTSANPCQTIKTGVGQCKSKDCGVFIAVIASAYQLDGTVDLSRGVSLIGGWHNHQPSVYQSLVEGSENGDQLFFATESPNTNVYSLILKGNPNADATKASSVMQLNQCTAVTFEAINIVSANGKKGADGFNSQAGASGNNGNWGGNGKPGQGGSSPCGEDNAGAGGTGGVPSLGDIHVAPKCAYWQCWSELHNGQPGGAGSTGYHAPGSEGAAKTCFSCPESRKHPGPADTGSSGRDATCGKGGTANSNVRGSFTKCSWGGNTGLAGDAGGIGGGGGGGGSGSFCGYLKCGCGIRLNAGTAGGGGGGGGCGATPSTGGAMGAATFGLILFDSQIKILGEEVIITAAQAGDGGKGGNGNSGGQGGYGGEGGVTDKVCYNTGGRGGEGGHGGRGSATAGSAGGNGGPSACIALVGESTITAGNPKLFWGLGGTGGKGGAPGPQNAGACGAPGGDDGNSTIAIGTIQY